MLENLQVICDVNGGVYVGSLASLHVVAHSAFVSIPPLACFHTVLASPLLLSFMFLLAFLLLRCVAGGLLAITCSWYSAVAGALNPGAEYLKLGPL